MQEDQQFKIKIQIQSMQNDIALQVQIFGAQFLIHTMLVKLYWILESVQGIAAQNLVSNPRKW